MPNSSHDVINVTNELGVSGQFLALARAGQLGQVIKLVEDRVSLAKKLAKVEGQLLCFGDLEKLAEYGHGMNEKDFLSTLPEVAARLEAEKRDLQSKLHQMDQLLREKKTVGDWEPVPTSLLGIVPRPKRETDPCIEERNKVIDANPKASHLGICRAIDKYCKDNRKDVRDYLPEGWEDDFGVKSIVAAYNNPRFRNRIQKMISVRRKESK